ncbi:MAG TPA: hypothetical protein VH040_14525 [Usitatibacter sp.]|jgi:hypothetical protein|nr:hypothetical protein [Usitatibacter sp.]
MNTIIAGGFDVMTDAQNAVHRLEVAGVSRDDLCRFRINPPGEHDALPAGGDRGASPGAKHASGGAVKGGAIGAVAGLVAGVAAAPLLPAALAAAGLAAGAGVGAYAGSLWGSLKEIDKEVPAGHDDVRPAETLVAVNLGSAAISREEVVHIFEECGARQIEMAEGEWLEGEWSDFDPVSAPQLIGGKDYGVRPRPGA